MSHPSPAYSSLPENVKFLNELIIRGDTLNAMEIFYADGVIMQDNEGEPRKGKVACIEFEKKMLRGTTSNTSRLLSQALDIENSIVFGEWEHNFTTRDNKILRLTETSVQHWKDGQIVREKFYYKEMVQVGL
jgi:hypothetical protein